MLVRLMVGCFQTKKNPPIFGRVFLVSLVRFRLGNRTESDNAKHSTPASTATAINNLEVESPHPQGGLVGRSNPLLCADLHEVAGNKGFAGRWKGGIGYSDRSRSQVKKPDSDVGLFHKNLARTSEASKPYDK